MASPYSMTAKDCSLGYPRYWGVNIDANTGQESWTALNEQEYLAFTEGGTLGCPTRGNFVGSGIKSRIEKTWLKLQDIPSYNNTVLTKLGVSQVSIEDQKFKTALNKILPYRAIFVMELRNAGIPVTDPNNLIDIVNKYIALKKTVEGKSIGGFNAKLSNIADPDAPKPKSGFDVSGLITGVVDIFSNIFNGINQGNAQAIIAEWTANFVEHMARDFAAIEAVLQQQGAQAALNKLLDYKNGSWRELKDTMFNYCAAKQQQVPQQFMGLIAQQEQLENRIKGLINTSGGGGADGTGGGPVPGQPKTFNWWYVIIPLAGIVAIVIIIGVISVVRKSSKKSQSTAKAA